jgi:hypothetical protein
MKHVGGVLVVFVLVLASVWAYNKFSGKSIADLGKA